MTWGGWIFMLASWAVILTVLILCLSRTLRCRQPPNGPDEPPQP